MHIIYVQYVPSTAPNTFGNYAISKNFCLTRICSATIDGNLKFFTILLRALDTLKTILHTMDWLIPTVLLKTAWNNLKAKKHSAIIIWSVTGRGEDLFCFPQQIITQNMCQIHCWVSWQPINSKQCMIRKGDTIFSVSKRPFWLSLPIGNAQYFHLEHKHLIMLDQIGC